MTSETSRIDNARWRSGGDMAVCGSGAAIDPTSNAGIMLIGADAYFSAKRNFLAELSQRYAVPAIYQTSEFAYSGGLMSYGGSVPDSYHAAGVYAGRILKGEKPADLPVQQSTKVHLILNLRAAKSLGITVPLPLLGRADEVIE